MREGFAQNVRALDELEVMGIFGIGGSASLLANFFLDQIPPESADFCIFDLSVFDRFLIFTNNYNIDLMDRYLSAAIEKTINLSIEPIILILPYYLNESVTIVRDKQIELAERYGCLYFDGVEWLNEFSKLNGKYVNDAFLDVNHLNYDYSCHLAKDLSAYVRNNIDKRFIKTGIENVRCVSSVDVISLSDIILTQTSVYESSSTIALTFAKITAGHILRIRTGHIVRVCGIVVNAVGSYGKIEIRGEGSVVKDLSFADQPEHLKFVARVVPFVGHVADKDGQIELSLAEEIVVPTEPTAGLANHYNPAESCLYVSHLLLERAS